MSDDVSYTADEVAKILRISRFTVYELIKRGELVAYRVGRKMRIDGADLANYKKKTKGESPVTPTSSMLSPGYPFDSQNGLIICGQDVVLDILTRHLERQVRNVRFLRQYAGSIEGLISLYNRSSNLATAHLWDGNTDEYNVPYVRHYLPGMRVLVVNLVYRMEGFYVAPGNPKQINEWTDLTRNDVRFVNRERGSGARVLIDEKLRKLDIDSRHIIGYENEELSHLAVASCVARGEADVGLGTEKAAMQVKKVEFIPLQKERYDMVLLKQDMEKPHFQALISILKSKAFQNEVDGMGGYDISRMGDVMAEI
jgi:putative molybdopterin biosynthesis protein